MSSSVLGQDVVIRTLSSASANYTDLPSKMATQKPRTVAQIGLVQADAGVNALNQNMRFDQKLHQRDVIFKTERAEKNMELDRKYLKRVKDVLLGIYYFFIPFIQAPAWCVKCYREGPRGKLTFFYKCAEVCGGIDLSSRIPKLAPYVTSCIDMVCLLFLAGHMYFITTYRKVSPGHKRRMYILFAISLVALINIIVSFIKWTPAYLSDFLRPIVFMLFSQNLRSNAYFMILLLKDSAVIIISTLCFVGFFAFTGYFMFKQTMEGFIYFSTPLAGLYNMFILLTTANFPNVMLPAYNENRFYCAFFIGYLVIGLYFLQNLLLAMIFDNYRKRVQEKAETKAESRVVTIDQYFERFDREKKGFLSQEQAKKFLRQLLDLDYTQAQDRITFRKFMKLVDLEGQGEITKQNVREFFSLPDFMMRLNSTQNRRESLRPQFDRIPVLRTSINNESPNRSGSVDESMQFDYTDEDVFVREPWQFLDVRGNDIFEADRTSFFDAARASQRLEGSSEVLREPFQARCYQLQVYLCSSTHIYVAHITIVICLFLIAVVEYMIELQRVGIWFDLWIVIAVLINLAFLGELIAYLVAFKGFKWIVQKKKVLLLEVGLQVISFFALIDFFRFQTYRKVVDGVQLECVVFLFRAARLLTLMQELQQWNLIISTFTKFSKPFMGMLLLTYTVYYIFAWFGMLLFGNKVTLDSKQTQVQGDQLYYLMNFNDFGASLVTLFAQMVVNNWYNTCDLMMIVTGARWPALYFVSFWIIQVNVMLNLVIAFVMEIYNSVSEDISREYSRREYVLSLRDKFAAQSQQQPLMGVEVQEMDDNQSDFARNPETSQFDLSSDYVPHFLQQIEDNQIARKLNQVTSNVQSVDLTQLGDLVQTKEGETAADVQERMNRVLKVALDQLQRKKENTRIQSNSSESSSMRMSNP